MIYKFVICRNARNKFLSSLREVRRLFKLYNLNEIPLLARSHRSYALCRNEDWGKTGSCIKENGEDRPRPPWFVMRDTCHVVNFSSFSYRRLAANFGFSYSTFGKMAGERSSRRDPRPCVLRRRKTAKSTPSRPCAKVDTYRKIDTRSFLIKNIYYTQ